MRWLSLILMLCFPAFAWAGAGTDAEANINGIWWSPNKDAKIELLIDSNGTLSGRLIALPARSANDTDSKNSDPNLKPRRLLGLTIFSGFRQEARNRWIDGKVYDASLGATFSAKLWLDNAEHLMVRGYLGLPLFGRDETFVRVAGNDPRHHQAGEPELVHLDTTKR